MTSLWQCLSRTRRPRGPGWLRVACPRDLKTLVESIGVEPFLPAYAVRQIVVPQPLDGNVELAVVLLVDRLHPGPGDRPLPPDPEDVAMQRHFARFIMPKITRSP